MSGVVLVEGGERVGVLDAAIGDIGVVVGAAGGGGDHGGAEGRGGVGAARAVLAVRGAQVGLEKEQLHLHNDIDGAGQSMQRGNQSFKCIKLNCFGLLTCGSYRSS